MTDSVYITGHISSMAQVRTLLQLAKDSDDLCDHSSKRGKEEEILIQELLARDSTDQFRTLHYEGSYEPTLIDVAESGLDVCLAWENDESGRSQGETVWVQEDGKTRSYQTISSDYTHAVYFQDVIRHFEDGTIEFFIEEQRNARHPPTLRKDLTVDPVILAKLRILNRIPSEQEEEEAAEAAE